MLAGYWPMLACHLADPARQREFVCTVARAWRLRQARLNGQRTEHAQAARAEAALQHLLAGDETRAALATCLMNILEASGHTGSLIECLNGLLKSFLLNRQAFRNRDTAQAYLNLFVLWHNMRVYQRGKRAGQSPYRWAGIDLGTTDWLALLGYPNDPVDFSPHPSEVIGEVPSKMPPPLQRAEHSRPAWASIPNETAY